jgi:mitosis inhibitor protein kinase SWE1
VAKRRSTHGAFYSSLNSAKPPAFGSPSFDNISRSPPKRGATTTKKSSGHAIEKPSFVRSRPQARQQLDFSSSSDTTSRMRRVTSVENFLAPMPRDSPFATRNTPLPSASAHPHVHPLSKRAAFGAARELDQLSTGAANDWTTPQNYKSAKPNIMAFHSTGFVPKRGRPIDTDKDHGPQPDTPCKRTTAFPGSAFQTKNNGPRIPMGDLGSPHTPAPMGAHSGLLLNRRNSIMSNGSYDQDDSQSSGDYELPPTPTRKSWNDFDDGSVFTMSNANNAAKRLRTESNCKHLILLPPVVF